VGAGAALTGCKLFAPGGAITIGRDAVVKERAVLNAFCGITIGDRTIIDRDVFAGGMQSEKSELVVGSDSVVLYRSYLNTTRKIEIGSNTGIGGYTMIFTHSSWQNALEGNPYRFANVAVKDGAWLAWGIIVMPGVVIGEGATVGSGAVVTKSLPRSVVAVGVPAKVIKVKQVEDHVDKEEKHRVMMEVMQDFAGYASGFLNMDNSVSADGQGGCIIRFKDSGNVLRYSPSVAAADLPAAGETVLVSFMLPASLKTEKRGDWVELDTLTARAEGDVARHFVAFVKRYGIRVATAAAGR
jgi:acetyltransferase-like isoleucine patch superfamily enzyme